MFGTATVDPSSSVLATSNGHIGMDAKNDELGSTSHGSFVSGAVSGMRVRVTRFRGLVGILGLVMSWMWFRTT